MVRSAYSAALAAAVIVVLIAVLLYLPAGRAESFCGRGYGCGGDSVAFDDDGTDGIGDADGSAAAFPELATGYPYGFAVDAPEAEPRLYHSSEVDPLITGQLYAGARGGRRPVYGARTSYGNKWGMREFSSGVSGQAGVDVGLLGMREYSLDGRADVFDDGIPEDWQFPSTPINWYAPQGEDYYDVDAGGPTTGKTAIAANFLPDHDPLQN